MFECMKKSFVMSGLNYSTIVFCDNRNMENVDKNGYLELALQT